ncbi:MAG: esterase [Anaerolineae bacterium]|nr:esterase [Anaerolineae bacterium]
MTTQLITTLGPHGAEGLGIILPHEHVFVDLRPPNTPGWAEAEEEEVVRLMGPELERARAAGIGCLVEATPVGVGRRVDLVTAVSRAVHFPVVVATGIYREPWVPDWAREADEGGLCEWMLRELTEGIENTNVRAGWIKLSAGDEGMTAVERRILRAAIEAALRTGAVIGSHTVRGSVAREQTDLIEQRGHDPSRFIWVHAQNEPDVAIHRELARRGVWIEYDGLGGGQTDEHYVERILRLLDAGFGERMMLSHDRGWYQPGEPGGGTPRPFTYLVESFLPKLRAAGVDEDTVAQLTQRNPFRAYARSSG